MQELQEQFREHFLRVHRSYLVNVNKIQELDLKHREILMDNGEKCLFSKSVKGGVVEQNLNERVQKPFQAVWYIIQAELSIKVIKHDMILPS